MPSITIRERDITSPGYLDNTTNAVYIPGYSNMGPTNTPVMCETLAEFQLIFGSEPYKFREAQEWPFEEGVTKPRGKFYEKGEFEKSYIMAAELLKLGIPVLYERVFYSDDADKWTAEATINTTDDSATSALKITACDPGLASTKLYYKLQVVKDVKLSGTSKGRYFIISVGRDDDTSLGVTKISETKTKITFQSEVAALYSDCILVYPGQTIKDNSGLVNLNFTENISETSDLNMPEEDISFLRLPTSTIDTTKDEFKVDYIYDYLSQLKNESTGEMPGLYKLLDKGEYVIKFITTGAYPVFEYNGNKIAQTMLEVAANRGDCTALIDHTPNNERTMLALSEDSVYGQINEWANTYLVNELGEDVFTYGAMFTPYGIYRCSTVGKDVMLPASHGYLSALATSIKTNGNWMAAAGVARGAVPNLVSLCQNLTNAIADSYQPRDGIAINPITNIKPYGLTIWGNRTLKNNAKAGDLTATSFLSIRQLTNDVKRTVWVAAKTLTFEQNSDLLWINFKSKLIPTLDQMVSGSGLSGYEIKKQKTTKKATVKAVVRLFAIEPVEDWDITIELADSSTEIAG